LWKFLFAFFVFTRLNRNAIIIIILSLPRVLHFYFSERKWRFEIQKKGRQHARWWLKTEGDISTVNDEHFVGMVKLTVYTVGG
jgi:hypothetical protein